MTKDLTGFELPTLPAPKSDIEINNSEESKPDVKELFYSFIDFGKEKLNSLKKLILNEKDVS